MKDEDKENREDEEMMEDIHCIHIKYKERRYEITKKKKKKITSVNLVSLKFS